MSEVFSPRGATSDRNEHDGNVKKRTDRKQPSAPSEIRYVHFSIGGPGGLARVTYLGTGPGIITRPSR